MYPVVTVGEKPGCVNCSKLKRALTVAGVEYVIRPYALGVPGPYPLVWVESARVKNYADLLKGLKMDMFKPSACFKPFKYSWAEDVRVKHERIHWVETEVNLRDDVTDWKSGALTQQEKEFISCVLRLFTQLDVEVGGLYLDFLTQVFKCNEIRNMLTSFACREAIHQKAYSLLNDTLGMPDCEYSAFVAYKEMTDKLDFMKSMDVSTIPNLARSLFKAVLNEGVSLFAAFVMLLAFQKRGRMKGMGKVVEWSVRDENIHVEGVSRLFETLCAEYPWLMTEKLVGDCKKDAERAAELEFAFIDLAFSYCPALDGLTPSSVKNYVLYVINLRASHMGLPKLMASAPSENPLPWVKWLIEGADLTNFFENHVTEYETGGLTGSWTYE
ncbi:ribonucleotide reductase beta subunit [Singapore grouper iridovirus]|nr:ribonucleotide reductase beta subunit [Singapore grouper iridovirus]